MMIFFGLIKLNWDTESMKESSMSAHSVHTLMCKGNCVCLVFENTEVRFPQTPISHLLWQLHTKNFCSVRVVAQMDGRIQFKHTHAHTYMFQSCTLTAALTVRMYCVFEWNAVGLMDCGLEKIQ